ncbi:MAG: hypothetical protein Q4D94_05350 [Bacillota bacterium]|nr:hypothetical protein [Bacillota bacterium]
MRVINYWEQFLSTGRINDYLAYRGCKAETAEEEADEPDGDEGAAEGAGTGQCYRNDIKG